MRDLNGPVGSLCAVLGHGLPQSENDGLGIPKQPPEPLP